MRNRILIKYYTTQSKYNIPVKVTLYEWIRIKFKGKRYITTINKRCTSINHAINFIHNVDDKKVISAQWIDRTGKWVDIISKGRYVTKTVSTYYISKAIHSYK